MDFTLNNGLIKTPEEARRLVVKRLPGFLWSLEARRRAADAATAPDSGHGGYTVGALVSAARDYLLSNETLSITEG